MKLVFIVIVGVPQMTVAGLVGQEVELPCTVDPAKCGELHSIKWYRGLSRIFVFSETANIAKSEGNFTDSSFQMTPRRLRHVDDRPKSFPVFTNFTS
ncbi:hypothetical protein Phum_PHUM057710 [Pediculus humanus corporis]|uniref:Ig-like domain-containing protein n=1 Tax=Pediculus humanus subsp. corporis TaxID=121224 RepID=E0VBC7_PEDHC|nr:uncharacterized protein Phum_PHUM057710 [Pediculus humanus corporis]EEB10683.1 hypothetical protein Phum_PHUM057710 [Pediculus humanus corporis]